MSIGFENDKSFKRYIILFLAIIFAALLFGGVMYYLQVRDNKNINTSNDINNNANSNKVLDDLVAYDRSECGYKIKYSKCWEKKEFNKY